MYVGYKSMNPVHFLFKNTNSPIEHNASTKLKIYVHAG